VPKRDEVIVLGEAVDDGEHHRLAANLRKALMKSMKISAQIVSRTASGGRSPARCKCSVLLR
jgi:hypothetical protein